MEQLDLKKTVDDAMFDYQVKLTEHHASVIDYLAWECARDSAHAVGIIKKLHEMASHVRKCRGDWPLLPVEHFLQEP